MGVALTLAGNSPCHNVTPGFDVIGMEAPIERRTDEHDTTCGSGGAAEID